MFSRLKTLALGAGLLLGAVLPLASQSEQHTERTTIHTSGTGTQIRWIHNGRSVEIRTDGTVELSEDETEVRRIALGGRFSLEERLRGGPDRRVEYRAAADGTLTRAYSVNGRPQAWDASARAWLAGILPEMARENGIGAEARVARIHARRGTAEVLEEVDRIRSGSSQTAHLRALLAHHPLSAGETARVLQQVRRIDSDSQKAGLLRAVLGRGQASEPTLVGVLESAAAIGSDSQKGSLLTEVAERYTLARPRVRDAFFAATGRIGSDTQRGRVATFALENRP